jgi:carboxynorspermidine decarboxylase
MTREQAFQAVSTPCYLMDEALLIQNLELLSRVKRETGCKILLAQKAFSMFSLYPLIGEYLDGATASGLYEARLGFEEMGRENHIFSPAYREEDFDEILTLCDHIVFNSLRQVRLFAGRAGQAGREWGLRINPECSTQEHAIYDPCSPGSRLGVTREQLGDCLPDGISGLHFHTLCEQDSDALETTLQAVEERFGEFLPGLQWLNFGGGHHITRPGYDIERLCRCINRMQQKYGVQVYLEPGEAVVLNTGFLVSSILEITRNGDVTNVILDTSAACHMPDVLEMPYRPPLMGSGEAGEKTNTYRLGGPTCLAGDIIGDYSFDHPLQEGDRLVFEDMALYTMVKNNTFNGMPLPAILLLTKDGAMKLVRQFGYEDFKNRLS